MNVAVKATPKNAGFVDRGFNHAQRKKRIEEEEKEIAKLEAEARGETVEEESNGEGSETAEVSDAGNTKQKETKPKEFLKHTIKIVNALSRKVVRRTKQK